MDVISEVAGCKIVFGVYNICQVLDWVCCMEFDLVEILLKVVFLVVKIIDYNKFFYEKKKCEKEIKVKVVKMVVKEICFGLNIDEYDFEFKLCYVQCFLEEGVKVKVYVYFCGCIIVFKDCGELLLFCFFKELEEFGLVEVLFKMEGCWMIVIVQFKKGKK